MTCLRLVVKIFIQTRIVAAAINLANTSTATEHNRFTLQYLIASNTRAYDAAGRIQLT